MTDEQLAQLIGGLTKAITDGNKSILEKLDALSKGPQWDPEKLKASTKDPKSLPGLRIVAPTSGDAQLNEPWPDPRIPKPPIQGPRGGRG